jgi:membrane protein
VAVAGQVLGPVEVQTRLMNQLTATIGAQGADLIQSMLANARKPTDSLVASILAIGTLILGAAGAFGQLQDALNTIWEVKARTGSAIRRLLAEKFLSFLMVMGLGLVLLVSLIASTALSALNTPLGSPTTSTTDILGIINLFVSFGVLTLVFAVILKVIPDVHLRWRDVWPGALLTAVLFTLGKYAIGWYLSHSSVGSAYGAAGSLVIILLWIDYSAQIFLLGAEFTKMYARRSGSPVRPTLQAQAVTAEARAQEGLASPAQPPDNASH